MKKLILLGIVLSLCSFGYITYDTQIHATNAKVGGRTIEIFTFDNCEYIGRDLSYSSGIFTHKGNCKFCLKRNK